MAAKVNWKGRGIYDRVARAAMRAVIEGAEAIEEAGARLIIRGPKTGRIYVRDGKHHQASAPGEPPADWTGKLVRSSRITVSYNKMQAKVTWRAKYADWLEYGTERIEPRPFARRAAASKAKQIEAAIARAIKNELRK